MYYPSLANEKLVDILRLIRTNNVGPVTFFQLMLRFGSAREALAALPNLSIRGGRKQALKPYSQTEAEREIEAVAKFGARFVRYGEGDYPALLHYISDAPPLLTIKGNSGSYQQQKLLAMVGSRNASANNCQLAQKLAREVSHKGVHVVSGLARGIDSFAHRGGLAAGTIAVIAGGVDNIYPPENITLYNEIVESGVLISEQAFAQVPFASAFPSRNRIIAGMSHATLVAEASPKSGSLITARLALEYNRELMAIPGSPLDPRAKGCNQLIKNGAYVIEEAADILQVMNSSKLDLGLSETQSTLFTAASVPEKDIQAAHEILLDKIGYTPVSVEELIEQCGLSSAITQGALLEMELAGKIRRVIGGKVALVFEDTQQTLTPKSMP